LLVLFRRCLIQSILIDSREPVTPKCDGCCDDADAHGAGRASAQLSCAREEELVADLRWLREACGQEGEAFPEGDEDTLVPSVVTAPECAT
jgi:hypothetical protein